MTVTSRRIGGNRPAGKPFFSVYNYLITHESHIFGQIEPKTDALKVTVPPFLPDKPAVRSILARNIDMVNTQDAAVAHLLAELKEDGLEDDTFVFFLADHGGVHPRSKRYCFDDGLNIPLIVQVPKNFEHLSRDPLGHASKRVVSHVDMAPTTLTLAGVSVASNMVGNNPDDIRLASGLSKLEDARSPAETAIVAAPDSRSLRREMATERISLPLILSSSCVAADSGFPTKIVYLARVL